MELRLKLKTAVIGDDGCYSVLLWDNRPFAVSIERTFEDNRVVITNGIYHCKRSVYHKGGYPTFEIFVKGRDRILFHKANVETDVEGCVGVGESFGQLNGQTAVLDSAGGFNELMKLAEGLQEFDMEVTGR